MKKIENAEWLYADTRLAFQQVTGKCMNIEIVLLKNLLFVGKDVAVNSCEIKQHFRIEYELLNVIRVI